MSEASRAQHLCSTPCPAPRLLLTAREAAEALAISPRLLWELTQPRGPIPAIRVGGSGLTARALRYYVDDLRAWIEAQREAAAGLDERPRPQKG